MSETNDLRKFIYTTIILFLIAVVLFIGMMFVFACGPSLTCSQAPDTTYRTPVPTLIPATLPVADRNAQTAFNTCQVAAVDLIGAWVSAGYPENDKFPFTDVKGTPCEGSFKKDVQPLFLESSLWYPGALACSSCHQSDLKLAIKNMDLSSYAGIVAGSNRANGEAKGNDILGGGDWESSLMYQMLYAPNGQSTIGRPIMPLGRPADVPEKGPLVYAGAPVGEPLAGGAAPAP
jgi:hypothetical protein